jgi:DNA-binding transcriptional ArsR family regulator
VVKAIINTAKKAKRGIEDSVQYAIGHRTRVHILIVLNEGEYTAAEISRAIDVELSSLYNHLRRMLNEGSIEIADETTRGNMNLVRYRAVKMQYFKQHEFETLPYAYRQNGKLADPAAFAYWDWFNLDSKGREDADALQYRYLREMQRFETESTKRSGDRTRSMLLQLMFFERPRKGRLRERRAYL